MNDLPAIRRVLATFRSSEAHVSEDELTAAWVEYDALRQLLSDDPGADATSEADARAIPKTEGSL